MKPTMVPGNLKFTKVWNESSACQFDCARPQANLHNDNPPCRLSCVDCCHCAWAAACSYRPHRRRPSASDFAGWRLGRHRRSLLFRAFQLSSRGKSNGWFLNQKAKPGDPFPTEYDFSKAPKLKVPGDWNTQRESLFFYEGPIWYERDFTYQPKEHTRVFLHVGAANYHSWFWVNGQKVCEHEGGFTSFNCEVTAAVHAGDNFVVAAVDNTRHEDGVPTLETDWWNYGGLHAFGFADRGAGSFHRSVRCAFEPHAGDDNHAP